MRSIRVLANRSVFISPSISGGMATPATFRWNSPVECPLSTVRLPRRYSALILLVHCHRIILEIKYQLSSGSITKDRYCFYSCTLNKGKTEQEKSFMGES